MSTLIPSESALADLGALISEQISPAAVSSERWSALVDLSLGQGLGPMLAWVLKKSQFSIPDEALNETLRQATKSSISRWLLLQAAQRRLQAAFAAASVQAIWIKGIVLANSIYPNPPLRPMFDIDVLVPYEQRQCALAAARKLGYLRQEMLLPDDLVHHYVLTGPAVNGHPTSFITVEIHSRLLGVVGKDSLLPAEQLEWFLQPEQLIQTRQGYTTLKPEAHFLYLCAHALLQHSETPLQLLRFFDIHLLITQASLDWEVVIAKAMALRWSLAVERALVLTRRYYSTPLANYVIPELRSSALIAAGRPMLKVNASVTDWDSTST